MANNLGEPIRSISLNSGLFGKKPTGVDVFSQGVVVHYKKGDTALPFGEIGGIRAFDYFAPNPISYHVELLDAQGKPLTAFAVPYENRADVTALLLAHRDHKLGGDFPACLPDTDYVLDDHCSWEGGKLIYRGRKGAVEYPLEQIVDFVEKSGSYFFNDTVGLIPRSSAALPLDPHRPVGRYPSDTPQSLLRGVSL